MVYRDLPIADAEARYKEIVNPDLPDTVAKEAIGTKVLPKKPRKKVVKPIVPKSA
jgi:hypothetical protein